MNKPQIILLDCRESLTESLVRDVGTFSFLLLCIWASQGSKWWTFFTALMFIAYLACKAAAAAGKRQNKFSGLDELEQWIAKQRASE